jgi:hypothetical protein
MKVRNDKKHPCNHLIKNNPDESGLFFMVGNFLNFSALVGVQSALVRAFSTLQGLDAFRAGLHYFAFNRLGLEIDILALYSFDV